MRRKDRELSDFDSIIQIMQQCEVCHVAFHDSEYPYVVPMNFGIQVCGNKVFLYFHGANVGKKHDLLKKNNKVAFVMENTHGLSTGSNVGVCQCTMLYESVMGTGVMTYLEGEEKIHALKLLVDHYHVVEGENYHFNEKMTEHTAVLKLTVDTLTAKQRKV